jgi:hypothetical protein
MSREVYLATELMEQYAAQATDASKIELTKEQLRILCLYKGALSYAVNAKLRNVRPQRLEEHLEEPWFSRYEKGDKTERKLIEEKHYKFVDKSIRVLNDIFASCPKLQKPVHVFRIIDDKTRFLKKEGQTIILPGFTSCSIEARKCLEYFGGEDLQVYEHNAVLLDITVAKGTPMIFIDALCQLDSPLTMKQGEVLFPPGITLTLTKKMPSWGKLRIFKATMKQ